MAKSPIPLPIIIEEEKKEECPKCPPVGAPAWMATFADMATLLMAFFVLILSFAEFNQPKFKMIAGSLKNAFGVQRMIPVTEQPKGTTVLELNFSPSPEVSLTKNNQQDTTDTEKPQPKERDGEADGEGDESADQKPSEQQQALADALADALSSGAVKVEMNEDGQVVMRFEQDKNADQKLAGAGGAQSQKPNTASGENTQSGEGGGAQSQNSGQEKGQETAQSPAQSQSASTQKTSNNGAPEKGREGENPSAKADEMAQMDQDAFQGQDPAVTTSPEEINNTNEEDRARAMADQLEAAAEALEKAAAATGQSTEDVLIAGMTENLQTLAKMARQAQSQSQTNDTTAPNSGGGQGMNQGKGEGEQQREKQAELKEAELKVSLREEIGQGLVEVERRNGKVFITVGSGGAFPSGSADITEAARDIVARISFASMGEASGIKVVGHTDDVPISSGQFRDNWDLAAARASAVVREIEQMGYLPATQMEAISKGESQPVADNATAEGREKNRRIEIEITYGDGG